MLQLSTCPISDIGKRRLQYIDTPEKEAIRREAETRKKAKQIKINFSADSTKGRDKGKVKEIRKGEHQKEKTKNIIESDEDLHYQRVVLSCLYRTLQRQQTV